MLQKVDCSRGAPMGRLEHHRLDLRQEPVELSLHYVRFVDGGYDEGGAYWGSPANLYHAFNEELGIEMFVRANWRKAAEDAVKRHYPKAKFIALTENDMTDFAKGYIECALWSSSTDEGDSLEGRNIQGDSYAKILSDCWDFQKKNAELLTSSGLTEEQQGHDFWLTRNGHGSGFWDRGLGEVGKKLSEAARAYSGIDLWLDSNGDVNGW